MTTPMTLREYTHDIICHVTTFVIESGKQLAKTESLHLSMTRLVWILRSLRLSVRTKFEPKMFFGRKSFLTHNCRRTQPRQPLVLVELRDESFK